MTPLGHCLTPQHFLYFRKKRTESREKQWCNWLSSRTAHPWWWLKLPLPDLLPRGKRQALVFHDMSHFTTFHMISKIPPLSSTRSNGATGAAGCVGTPHPWMVAATSTPGPAAQVVPPSQPAQGHTSSFRLPLIYVDIPSGWEGRMT